MQSVTNITDVVAALSSITLPDLFNPYTDHDSLHDLPNAPRIRRTNLTAYLTCLLPLRPRTAWIAESGSHTGTRRSGLPLVPTTAVDMLNEQFDTDDFRTATASADKPGMTAGYVWEAALQRPTLPLFWNVIMAQPHQPGRPYVNRSPRAAELRAYAPVLDEVLRLFGVTQIVAIGRVAERCLQNLSYPATYVRHPAQGGAAAFRAGIQAT